LSAVRQVMMAVDHTKNIIEVVNVSFSYGSRVVLENVSLTVHQGDYLALIGPNGAGKTTLLKMMLGLIRPARGNVRLFGQDGHDFRDYQKISYVPQQTANFDSNFPVTVYEVAAMGRYGQMGIGRSLGVIDKQAIEAALRQAGMWEKRMSLVGELSGGQQQRTLIARALSGEPEVMFLDEPTRGLDPAAQEELYNLLRRLNRESGLTLVLVSHDIEKITREAMHIACLDRHLVCHNSPAEFLADSELVSLFGEKIRVITHHHHD